MLFAFEIKIRSPSNAFFKVAVLNPPLEQICARLPVAWLIASWRALPFVFKKPLLFVELADVVLMFTIVDDM